MLKCFPPHPGRARGRIIGLNANEGRKKLYHFVDYLYFGYTEDIETFFSVPLLEEPIALPFLDPKRPFTCEGYLCSEYAKKIGCPIVYTEEEYLSLLGRQFAIVDSSSLDWYFYRPPPTWDRFLDRPEFIYARAKDMKIDFAFWLELYKKEQAKLRGA
jgi:hypothetical protein